MLQVVDKIEGYVQQMHDMLDTYKASLVQHVTFDSANQIADMEAKMLTHRMQKAKKVSSDFSLRLSDVVVLVVEFIITL